MLGIMSAVAPDPTDSPPVLNYARPPDRGPIRRNRLDLGSVFFGVMVGFGVLIVACVILSAFV